MSWWISLIHLLDISRLIFSLGKNISLLEIGKLVPQLLRVFEIEWSGPRDGWTLDNEGFLFQRDCIFTLKERLKESTIQILQSKE